MGSASDELEKIRLLEDAKGLNEYLVSEGLGGPVGVQLVLFWAGVILRDEADMPELSRACIGIGQQVAATYHARVAAVEAQTKAHGSN